MNRYSHSPSFISTILISAMMTYELCVMDYPNVLRVKMEVSGSIGIVVCSVRRAVEASVFSDISVDCAVVLSATVDGLMSSTLEESVTIVVEDAAVFHWYVIQKVLSKFAV